MNNLSNNNNFNGSMPSSSSNFQRQQQNNPSKNSVVKMERSQMSEDSSSSIPNGFVEVDIGNFAITTETINNKDTEKLYVKENYLEDGFIRKYVKRGNKWKCCRCISKNNSRKRTNNNTVYNYSYGKIKEARQIGNTLFVAKAHSSNSCEPYPQGDFEFPICDEKPNVDLLKAAANSAPITFQMPDLSLPSPDASLSTTPDHFDFSFTNSIPSSSRRLLYSPKSANNQMRSGSLPPRFLRRVESSSHTVTQQQPQQPAASSLTLKRAQPEIATVSQQPTQEIDVRHTVTEQPPPVNVNPRSVNDPGVTDGAVNFKKKSRAKSNTVLPEDPTDSKNVKVKTEENSEDQNDYPARNNANKEKKEEEDEIVVSFPCFYEKPLQAACKKLNLDSYCRNQVLQVWTSIEIQVVKSRSDSIKSGEKLNGFECLSLLLTGSQENSYELYGNLKDKLQADTELNVDLAQQRELSKKFCEEHLNLIADWISCPIGVYEHGILNKYGDWRRSSELNDLILLIEKQGEKYAPVFNLD